LKRGEIWTVSSSGYAGKPRPAVIVQGDHSSGTASVSVCAFTTNPGIAPLIRVEIHPSSRNDLREPCKLMVDKLTTVPRSSLGRRIGHLAPDDEIRLDRAMMVFLGLAGRSLR
jgi:mRNA interferase MazF